MISAPEGESAEGALPEIMSSATEIPHVRYVDLRDGAATVQNGPEGVARRGTPIWQRWYVLMLIALDSLSMIVSGLLAIWVRFDNLDEPLKGLTYSQYVVAAAVPWIGIVAASRGYDSRFLGLESGEFRRVGKALVRFAGLLAVVAFLLDIAPAGGMVAVALPSCFLMTLTGRSVARRVLHLVHSRGVACHRVLLIGEVAEVATLERRLLASPHPALHVVGRCRSSGDGSPVHVRAAIEACGADAVVLGHSRTASPEALRRMGSALAGANVGLLAARAPTDLADLPLHACRVPGLPLLHIISPQSSGGGRLLKRAIDIVAAVLGLVVLSPLMLPVATSIALTSRGPAVITQERIGRGGKPFRLYKFRSMCRDARVGREEESVENEGERKPFPWHECLRVTSIGRWLCRYSIDELPQLVNVLLGHMSLVGPRPPLPSEVEQYEQYEQHVQRRLMVTPGITGLWQVSGRSDLSWAETVRLDRYYAENWSVALDAEILWKTAFAVLRGSGAH